MQLKIAMKLKMVVLKSILYAVIWPTLALVLCMDFVTENSELIALLVSATTLLMIFIIDSVGGSVAGATPLLVFSLLVWFLFLSLQLIFFRRHKKESTYIYILMGAFSFSNAFLGCLILLGKGV